MTVGDVTSRRVWTCAPDDEVQVALDAMKTHRVRRLPVVADGSLVGIVSMNDVVLAAGAGKAVRNEEVVDTLRAICADTGAKPLATAA